MQTDAPISGYRYEHASCTHAHDYLLPKIELILENIQGSRSAARLFDLGCGNGSVAAELAAAGWDVTGVDPSVEGITQARRTYPGLRLEQGSAYDDLVARFGRFPVVLSLEVVEHVYDPRHYARTLFDLVEPGGMALISTPYHGYWKNLALALTGRMDNHYTVLWDHGHIKFWSIRTLGLLLEEAGFRGIRFFRVGRVPILAKSMIAVATRP